MALALQMLRGRERIIVMIIGNLERIFGATTRDVLNCIDSAPQGSAARKQLTVVHSVIDQIGHHHPSDACVAFLREQAKEELLRLMRLMKGACPDARRTRFCEVGVTGMAIPLCDSPR